MKNSTKATLIALGALAGIAAISAIAIYEEDKNNRVSHLIDDVNRQARRSKRQLRRQWDDLSFTSDRPVSERLADSAWDVYDQAVGRGKDIARQIK